MSLRHSMLLGAIVSGALLLAPTAALACRGDCGCDHSTTASKAVKQTGDAKAKPEQGVSATCNCEGPSDCTCKKGQCKCKKCSKHHAGAEAKKT